MLNAKWDFCSKLFVCKTCHCYKCRQILAVTHIMQWTQQLTGKQIQWQELRGHSIPIVIENGYWFSLQVHTIQVKWLIRAKCSILYVVHFISICINMLDEMKKSRGLRKHSRYTGGKRAQLIWVQVYAASKLPAAC